MSISRPRRAGGATRRKNTARKSMRKDSTGRVRNGTRRPVDPTAWALPGTALHRLLVFVGEVSRGASKRRAENDDYLHLRNPLQAAAELKKRIVSLPGTAQKTIAARLSPDTPLPRKLPLGVLAFVVGVAMLATQRYWAMPFAGYGAVALIHDAVVWRRFRKRLLAGVDGALKPDLRQLSSDRTRAQAIGERFRESGSLDFLEVASVPDDLALPQGERVVLSVDHVLKAKETRAGLLKEAEGTLLVTTARLLFLAGGDLSELDLDKVIRADVVDELRLVVVPSKREAPGLYIAFGRAHALAQVIRLARENLRAGG